MNKEFETFAEVINHYSIKLLEKMPKSRDSSGTGDDYKKKIREMNQEFYSVPAVKVLVDGSHKAYPFWTVGELLTEVFGMNPPLMDRYKPDIIEWSYKLRPDRSAEYMYGRRWQEFNEIFNAIDILSERPDSKRVYIPIFAPYDTDPNRKDAPCTLGYDVKIRNGQVDMTTFFRSHDFFAGFKYDILLSSFMCQLITMAVNAKGNHSFRPGRLYFYEGSLHSYGKDEDKLISAAKTTVEHAGDFDVMYPYNSVEELYSDLLYLKKAENSSYWGRFDIAAEKIAKIKNQAIADFAKVFYNRNAKYAEIDERMDYTTNNMIWSTQ